MKKYLIIILIILIISLLIGCNRVCNFNQSKFLEMKKKEFDISKFSNPDKIAINQRMNKYLLTNITENPKTLHTLFVPNQPISISVHGVSPVFILINKQLKIAGTYDNRDECVKEAKKNWQYVDTKINKILNRSISISGNSATLTGELCAESYIDKSALVGTVTALGTVKVKFLKLNEEWYIRAIDINMAGCQISS
ncbi:hypothetical protein [Selenihalanaerobacter shriftii]|uniref:Uncharacterized protein n=1 Tax=Selenihalanaerobacter shriftii TaxID=142842 RepID=A0A1T4JJV8_9FIRM|nr:hypothetical protein [Selenihalanaerobacter shriftii]SJZ30470.1 hypothetical protein SAMN02745118_00069 [Selenihalanaerobacter shriftii]